MRQSDSEERGRLGFIIFQSESSQIIQICRTHRIRSIITDQFTSALGLLRRTGSLEHIATTSAASIHGFDQINPFFSEALSLVGCHVRSACYHPIISDIA